MNRHSLDAAQRHVVRRTLALFGALLGLIGAVLVFVVSMPMWLSPGSGTVPFLAGEALALLLIGPLAGALLGASCVRLPGFGVAILSVVACVLTSIPTGFVASVIWRAFDREMAMSEGLELVTLGATIISPVLIIYGLVVGYILAKRRDAAILRVRRSS